MVSPIDGTQRFDGTAPARANRVAMALVALAFVLAMGSAWKMGVHQPSGLTQDDHLYYSLAQSLVHQHRFAMDGNLATFWPPAYPFFLAAVALVSGPGVWGIYFAQSVLYAAALWCVYRITFTLTGGARLAVASLAFCLFWPPFYTGMTSQVMSENLALPLGAFAFWGLLEAMRRKTLGWWALTGVLFGAAGLTRPPLLIAGVGAVAYLTLRPRFTRQSAAMAAAFLVGAMLILTPWLVRGYLVTGGFVPISSQGPYNLYLGNAPEYYRTGDVLMRWFNWHPYAEHLSFPTKALNHEFMWMTAANLKENPVRALGFMVRKFTQLWMGDLGRPPVTSRFGHDRMVMGWAVPIQSFVCVPVFMLAAFGWFTLGAQVRRRLMPLMWGLAAYTLAYVALYTEMRYAFPMYPYVLILAAAGLLRLLGLSPRPKTDSRT